MMGGNPSWWNMHNNLRSSSTRYHHQHNPTCSHNHLLLPTSLHINLHNNSSTASPPSSSSSSSTSSSSSSLPFSSLVSHHHHHHHHPHQEFPHSWSQLLLGGLGSEQEERFGPSLFKVDDVKQEVTSSNTNNNNNNNNLLEYNSEVVEEEGGVGNKASPWSLTFPLSSPKSCITSLSSNTITNNKNNMLDFSTSKISFQGDCQHVHHSNSESNSSANGGAPNKKAKVQSSSNPPLKVRKEKLGDRITTLHQIVSPFGKTDTASVLLEAIGYIRFLQGQIEALSSPYMGSSNASNQQYVYGERNCLFPEHPGQEVKDATSDLQSRGLCLVPISYTQLIITSDNGADYWVIHSVEDFN